jgi:hypothetical protein
MFIHSNLLFQCDAESYFLYESVSCHTKFCLVCAKSLASCFATAIAYREGIQKCPGIFLLRRFYPCMLLHPVLSNKLLARHHAV